MALSPLGQIAQGAWHDFADRHPKVSVDIFIIMPNHLHVLLWLAKEPETGLTSGSGNMRSFGQPIAGSLSILIGAYKSAVTQKAKHAGLIPGPPLWQRNFYDRVVRGEEELMRIREYIRTNPTRWMEDQLHPDAPPNRFNRDWRRPS